MTTLKENTHFLENILKPEDHIAMAVWQTDDVICALIERFNWEEWEAEQMPIEYLNDIIDFVDHNQDASLGISWETIYCAIEYFFELQAHYEEEAEAYARDEKWRLEHEGKGD